MSESSTINAAYRSCAGTRLVVVLSLGHTPLANALLTAEQLRAPEEKFPLDLAFCPDCTLVQITETVPPEKLFREYFYLSSFSDTMLRHAEDLARRVTQARGLNAQSLVAEVASNDGYLLQFYKQAGVRVLGIEPARNIARVAETERGIPTVWEFFGAEAAAELVAKGERADVIHANNVLAHVADLNGFVAGLALLLDGDGAAVLEVRYLTDISDQAEFDTIYHEHLCYFSLTALAHLFRRHALQLEDVERISLHGGSLLLTVGKADSGHTPSPSVAELLRAEAAWGVGRLEFYQGFGTRVARR